MFSWVYQKRVRDPLDMTNLPLGIRRSLPAICDFGLPETASVHNSPDGNTHKFVLRLADGARVESVSMRTPKRLTFCISSQVGCALKCSFCATGLMGLKRNLKPHEIVAQVMAMGDFHGWRDDRFNIVYMGMGEPLANYAATVTSLRILTDPKAFGFSPRRITVSTVGLVSGIERLAKENLKVNLAISLHATSNQIRNRIMPVNKGFAIEELLEACRGFPMAFRQRITFEYVLLDRVNDSAEDAKRLVRLLKGIRSKVNLIPFNDWDGSGFQRPPLQRILGFQSLLLEEGIRTTIRWSKGEDIGAACGQLKEAVTV
jgi:23S rRNA (adenine2503-C2)-methyltransferase